MQPTNVNQAATETPDEVAREAAAEQEPRILTSVKVIAQRITERVQKALVDTDTHAALPIAENPPIP
jgi:hypothetical protein